ncbi:hypothetical protein HN947_01790 [Candidatus Woesearchaeota archaeon]|nr:hypothetical protein [Candidatus Woesearchaeota archaeon]
MSKRGQSLLESFMLLILVIGAVMPILFFSADRLGDSFRISQAEDSLNNVAITARAVSSLGEGNSDVSIISIPEGVTDFYVDYGTLVFMVNNEEIKVKLGGEIVGKLPTVAGIHSLQVRALPKGKIKLGDGPYVSSLENSCIFYGGPFGNNNIETDIYGTDFDNVEEIYSNGVLMEDLNIIDRVQDTEIELTIRERDFPGSPEGVIYSLAFGDSNGYISNSFDLTVKTTFC